MSTSRRNQFRNTLSKNLMQMKFMQKTVDKTQNNFDEHHNKSLLDQQNNESLRKEGQKYVVDNSYLYCERLIFGRMSFKGMNPEIEKLMQELDDNSDKSGDKCHKNDDSVDVSDEEMTNRYSKYVDSNAINRKRSKYSNKQRNRSDKRFKSSHK